MDEWQMAKEVFAGIPASWWRDAGCTLAIAVAAGVGHWVAGGVRGRVWAWPTGVFLVVAIGAAAWFAFAYLAPLIVGCAFFAFILAFNPGGAVVAILLAAVCSMAVRGRVGTVWVVNR